MAGEIFEFMMKDNDKIARAFEQNRAFQEMLVNLFLAVNELADRKGVDLEDMEIINPTISNDRRLIRIEFMPHQKAVDSISPILGANGQNIRRDRL